MVVALGAAFAIASGHLHIGLALVIGAAVPDLLDGPLAKASGTVSPRGAFFDSVSDRVTDSLLLGGVAWYLDSTRGAHAALLPFAVAGASLLISYERAKAESLGFDAKGGIMERAERVVVLCIGLLLPFLLVPVLWAMLVLTLITAVQRFFKVWGQASSPPKVRSYDSQRWTVAAMEARWKARREAALSAHPDRARVGAGSWRRRRESFPRNGGHRPRSRP